MIGGFSAYGAIQTATPAINGPASSVATGQSSLSELQQMIDHGHGAEALERLDKMAVENPVPDGVHRLRGQAFYSQNKLTDAEQAFATAMTQDPTDLASEQMRGVTLFRLGRPAAAIPLLEATAQTNKSQGAEKSINPVDPWYVLALCYLDTRQYDDARRAFATQYGFPPDSAPAYLLAARMLLRREYIPVAQQFAKKALELSPQLPLAHRLLGETELAANHLDDALKEFDLERQLNPLDPVTYDRMGDAYVRQGEFGKARQALQEAVLLDPNSTGPFILLGKVLLRQHDAVGAATYLEHAREMDSQNYMTHSLLSQAYRQMGRIDDARAESSIAQKLQAAAEPKLTDLH